MEIKTVEVSEYLLKNGVIVISVARFLKLIG